MWNSLLTWTGKNLINKKIPLSPTHSRAPPWTAAGQAPSCTFLLLIEHRCLLFPPPAGPHHQAPAREGEGGPRSATPARWIQPLATWWIRPSAARLVVSPGGTGAGGVWAVDRARTAARVPGWFGGRRGRRRRRWSLAGGGPGLGGGGGWGETGEFFSFLFFQIS
jgi:hypothetical protein